MASESCCGNCRFMRGAKVEGRLACHRYPPTLTADGPLIIKNPKQLPKEIPMDSTFVLPIYDDGGIYRITVQGFPLVEKAGWCGEHWPEGDKP